MISSHKNTNFRKIFILISTFNTRIMNLKNIINVCDNHVTYIISHQVNEELEEKTRRYIDSLCARTDVCYSALKGKGVSKNRNNTLRFIEPSSICLILDDDVQLCKNVFSTIIRSFNDNSTADFISFKILDLEGNDYKPYPKEKQWHTLRTLTGIGTTEMAFRSDLILDHDIRFDERFGPGAGNYPLGEDYIFAMDLYHLKIKMLFLPIPIVKHPCGSTGRSLDRKIIFARGAMFARVFGWKAFVINFLFSIKKYTVYRKEISFFPYLTLLAKGTIDYFISSTKRTSCKS